MCDNEKSSIEHDPSKCLFPETKDLKDDSDLRNNLITVPSCDSQKSKEDEYLQYILVASCQGNSTKQNHRETKVKRANARKPHIARAIVDKAKTVIQRDAGGKVMKMKAITVDVSRLNQSFEHIMRGIYFHHTNEKLMGRIKNIITNVLFDTTSKNATQINYSFQQMTREFSMSLSHVSKHGCNQEIFWSKLLLRKTAVWNRASFFTVRLKYSEYCGFDPDWFLHFPKCHPHTPDR